MLGAAAPDSGDFFAILMPWLNTETFQAFLDEFAKHSRCGEDPKREVWLAIDRAGWHIAKALRPPRGMRLVLMPTAAAQINPTERVWLYMRDHHTRCRVLKGLDDLEETLVAAITELLDSPETVRSVCAKPQEARSKHADASL